MKGYKLERLFPSQQCYLGKCFEIFDELLELVLPRAAQRLVRWPRTPVHKMRTNAVALTVLPRRCAVNRRSLESRLYSTCPSGSRRSSCTAIDPSCRLVSWICFSCGGSMPCSASASPSFSSQKVGSPKRSNVPRHRTNKPLTSSAARPLIVQSCSSRKSSLLLWTICASWISTSSPMRPS